MAGSCSAVDRYQNPIPQRSASQVTVIETAKLNGLDPQAYLADILSRIQDHKINRLDELLPWNWAPAAVENSQAA